MQLISGYEILETVAEGQSSLVYRGQEQRSGNKVILKVLNFEFPTPSQINRFKREYDILRRFDSEGIIKVYKLERYKNSLLLSMEDIGGRSLSRILKERNLSIIEALRLGVRIARSLEEIHEQGIVHKDINPANIVWNPRKDLVKIIDFGIAGDFLREKPAAKNLNMLEGTIKYMSPEQTGRMNRYLDYRTDFYSLGATLFEMLRGAPPFTGDELMELVYAHIARNPPSLDELDHRIPGVVAMVLNKLLAKNADERYQSSSGLIHDLERILYELERGETVSRFPIGLFDSREKFEIPQKIYGRNRELAELTEGLSRVKAGAAEAFFVSGESGVGKTFLVEEIRKEVTICGGNFIKGKFDQLERNIPYSSIIQAFRDLIRRILTLPEVEILNWTRKIQVKLGVNEGVISEVIPDLKLIIGDSPGPEELSPHESENRFQFTFRRFVEAFCSPETPLILFLDDLQWADIPTLRFLEFLFAPGPIESLMLIATSRRDYPDEIIRNIRELERNVTVLEMKPLGRGESQELISDTLEIPYDKALEIAEITYSKTGGNPFYMARFLRSCYENHLFLFQKERNGSGKWTWDLPGIEKLAMTENVADLIIQKIDSLSESALKVVEIAACIGNQFDLTTLAGVSGESEFTIAGDLAEAIRSGVIIALDERYKYYLEYVRLESVNDEFLTLANDTSMEASLKEELEEKTGQEPLVFSFLHDRIQQAAYERIDDQKKPRLHYELGRQIIESVSSEEPGEKIYEITNHLNLASHIIIEEAERLELANYNYRAGLRARASAAYQQSFVYFSIARGLLPDKFNDGIREITWKIYSRLAEAAYLNGNHELTEDCFQFVETHATKLEDRIPLYESRIRSRIALSDFQGAVEISLEALRLMGVRLPRRANKIRVVGELLLLRVKLTRNKSLLIEDLNVSEDRMYHSKVRILSNLGLAAYVVNQELLPLVIFKSLRMSLTRGLAPLSPFIFAGYGMILGGALEDFKGGYFFGELARRLEGRFIQGVRAARTKYVITIGIRHWREPMVSLLPEFLEVYRQGVDEGDFEFASLGLAGYLNYSFFIGHNLDELSEERERYHGILKSFNQGFALNVSNMYRQAIFNLRNDACLPTELKGPFFDQEDGLDRFYKLGDANLLHNYYYIRMYLSYVMGEISMAQRFARKAREYLEAVLATPAFPYFYFYEALSLIADYHKLNKKEKRRRLKHYRKNLKKLRKYSMVAPRNYLNKYYLLEAELAALQDRTRPALDYYEKSARLAGKNGFIHEQALACELHGNYWIRIRKPEPARLYLEKAFLLYRMWGARSKMKELSARFSSIAPRDQFFTGESTTGQSTSDDTSTSKHTEEMDLRTVLMASQTLSGEIVLDSLLRKMMRIIIENAGARRGFLILNTLDEVRVESRTSESLEEIFVTDMTHLDPESLPESVIRYVLRTSENVVMSGEVDDNFRDDPYFQNRQPSSKFTGSLFCSPMLYQERVSGVLFLENDRLADAFAEERIEVIQILLSQAAISYENARLFMEIKNLNKNMLYEVQERFRAEEKVRKLNEDLERKVERRTAELKNINRELESFSYSVSHDLRAPLRGINGFSEALEEDYGDDLDETARGYLGRIRKACLRMNNLIDDMLNLSQIAKSDLTIIEVDLSAMCLEILNEYKLNRPERKTAINIEPAIKVPGDPGLLRILLVNLIGNAWKYSSKKDITMIDFGMADTPRGRAVYLRDNGAGFDMARADKLFAVFQRLHKEDEFEGTGVGLATVQRVIYRHSGEIWAQGAPGEGATFYFTLGTDEDDSEN